MAKFQITLETNEKVAEDILTTFQLKVYRLKLRSFLSIIGKKLGRYKGTQEKDKRIFYEESDDLEHLKLEKKKMESFLYSDSSELTKGNSDFKALVSDRLIQKLNKNVHKFTNSMKTKAFNTVLGGGEVISFFNRIGIMVSLEIIE